MLTDKHDQIVLVERRQIVDQANTKLIGFIQPFSDLNTTEALFEMLQCILYCSLQLISLDLRQIVVVMGGHERCTIKAELHIVALVVKRLTAGWTRRSLLLVRMRAVLAARVKVLEFLDHTDLEQIVLLL